MSDAFLSVTPVSRAAGLLGAICVLLIGLGALMQPLPPAAPATKSAANLTPGAAKSCTLRPDGFLRGRFFGALSLTADWSGAELFCDGMQRPDAKGVRLFFAREVPQRGRVSVLIGIDGRMENLAGAERPANVTVIDEQTGRFFSSGGPGRCWASISAVTTLRQPGGGSSGHRIDGIVYCLGALPSVSDRSSLTLSELHFAGRVIPDGK